MRSRFDDLSKYADRIAEEMIVEAKAEIIYVFMMKAEWPLEKIFDECGIKRKERVIIRNIFRKKLEELITDYDVLVMREKIVKKQEELLNG